MDLKTKIVLTKDFYGHDEGAELALPVDEAKELIDKGVAAPIDLTTDIPDGLVDEFTNLCRDRLVTDGA